MVRVDIDAVRMFILRVDCVGVLWEGSNGSEVFLAGYSVLKSMPKGLYQYSSSRIEEQIELCINSSVLCGTQFHTRCIYH